MPSRHAKDLSKVHCCQNCSPVQRTGQGGVRCLTLATDQAWKQYQVTVRVPHRQRRAQRRRRQRRQLVAEQRQRGLACRSLRGQVLQ